MRLVAQRVRSPSTHREGINAFCYLHGPVTWLDDPPADLPGGVLMNARAEVPPPGNRVRSYLEIVAPDETPSHVMEREVEDSIDLLENQPFPLRLQSGDTTFQFDVESALAPAWRQEMRALLHRALEVRV